MKDNENTKRNEEIENENIEVSYEGITQEELEKIIDERVELAIKQASEKREKDLEDFAKKFNQEHDTDEETNDGKSSAGKKIAIGAAVAAVVAIVGVVVVKALSGDEHYDGGDDPVDVEVETF